MEYYEIITRLYLLKNDPLSQVIISQFHVVK